MEEPRDSPFQVETPLGWSVRTSQSYWLLIETKHPKLIGRSQAVRDVLSHPTEIYRSRTDATVYLFYGPDGSRLLCAVVRRLNDDGFLVTAYPCEKPKEGERIWPR